MSTLIKEYYCESLLRNFYPVADSDPALEFLRRYLPANRGAKIVDMACGNGRYAVALASMKYTNVIGVDLFDNIQTHGAFLYQKGLLESTGMPADSVDLVFCLSGLYYLEDPLEGMREYARILKPGGHFIMSAHTKYSLHTLDRKVRRFFGGAEHLQGVTFYSTAQYASMLRKASFKIDEVDGYNFLYSPFFKLEHVLRKMIELPCLRLLKLLQIKAGCQFRSECAYHCLLAATKPDV